MLSSEEFDILKKIASDTEHDCNIHDLELALDLIKLGYVYCEGDDTSDKFKLLITDSGKDYLNNDSIMDINDDEYVLKNILSELKKLKDEHTQLTSRVEELEDLTWGLKKYG